MSIERQQRFVNKSSESTEKQIIVTGSYRKNQTTGTEILTWNYRMGGGQLVFIANLPQALLPEDERRPSDRSIDEAPVYVKFKILDPGPNDERATVNNPDDPTEAQLTLTGRLRAGLNDDTEVFVVVLRLGLFELVCIANIPQILYDESDRFESDRPIDQAPVYVKTKILPPQENEKRDRQVTREAPRAPETFRPHAAREPALTIKNDRHAH